MSGITLGKALEYFSSELGCGDGFDRDQLINIVVEAIEFLLLNGGGGILREWKVVVRNGRFTFPRDLETPVKYKFSRLPNAGFGSFHSPYVSYSSNGIQSCCDFYDWNHTFAVSANKVATTYHPPQCGLRLLATTREDLDVGKKLMAGGKLRGMDVAPMHNGYKTSGELLTIYKEDDNEKKYGAYKFDDITHVIKDLTCAYVMLSGLDDNGEFYFLSYYHPDETVPQYTEGELFACPSQYSGMFNGLDFRTCDFHMHILGRINPSTRYIRDEDVLPIPSFQMLKLLAKRARYDESGDFNEVGIMEQRIRVLIKTTVAYQQAPIRQLSVNIAGSGGSLTNL